MAVDLRKKKRNGKVEEPELLEDGLALSAHFEWLPLGSLEVDPEGQRRYRPDKAQYYAERFQLEAMGYPVVNKRDKKNFVVDGQHRVGALRLVGFLPDDVVECEVYDGLTPEGESALFLMRNDRTAVSSFDTFRLAMRAGRELEVAVNKIVLAQQLKIARTAGAKNSISAVGSLIEVYNTAGGPGLGRTLRLLRDSFDGHPRAFAATTMKGMAQVIARYGTAMNDDIMVTRMLTVRGGGIGLIRKAEALRIQTGRNAVDCMCATIVDTYTGRPNGGKLDKWWS